MNRNVTHEPHHVTFVNRLQIDGDFSREIVLLRWLPPLASHTM